VGKIANWSTTPIVPEICAHRARQAGDPRRARAGRRTRDPDGKSFQLHVGAFERTQGPVLAQGAYGRFEARIKVAGRGREFGRLFWMLGDNITADGWPKWRRDPTSWRNGLAKETGNQTHGSLHWPKLDECDPAILTNNDRAGPPGKRLVGRFFIFLRVEWEPGVVRFLSWTRICTPTFHEGAPVAGGRHVGVRPSVFS